MPALDYCKLGHEYVSTPATIYPRFATENHCVIICLLGTLWYSLIDHLPRRYISFITLLHYIVYLPCVELVVVVASCVA